MARTATANTADYLSNSSAPVTAPPLTLSCWWRAYTTATAETIFGLFAATASDLFSIRYSGGNFSARTTAAGVTASSTAAAATATGVAYHLAAVFVATDNRLGYVAGVPGTLSTGALLPTNINTVAAGLNFSLTKSEAANGEYGELAIYNAALASGEINSLAKGVSALNVRPDKLVFYCPAIGRQSPEPDLKAARNMTVTGAPARADHFRIYKLRKIISGTFKAAAAGVTTSVSAAAIAVGVAVITLQARKILAATAVGVTVESLRAGKVAAATAVGVAGKTLQARKILAAVAVGVAGQSNVITTVKTAAAIAVGVAAISLRAGKIAAATAVGVPGISLRVGKLIAATAVGVAAKTLQARVTFAATAVGVAAVTTSATIALAKFLGHVGSWITGPTRWAKRETTWQPRGGGGWKPKGRGWRKRT